MRAGTVSRQTRDGAGGSCHCSQIPDGIQKKATKPAMPSDRTRVNGHKLKDGKFHLNIGEYFSALEVIQH